MKVGRTHLMDATPLTLGQEFSRLGGAARVLRGGSSTQSLDGLYELALGGTAVGTGLNTHPKWAETVAARDRRAHGRCRSAPRPTSSPRSPGTRRSSPRAARMRTLAVACFKIASDVRLLGSGPRCGIGELHLPENEPGSSIMPGKVNPTQARR